MELKLVSTSNPAGRNNSKFKYQEFKGKMEACYVITADHGVKNVNERKFQIQKYLLVYKVSINLVIKIAYFMVSSVI